MGRGAWQATVHVATELDKTERHFFFFFPPPRKSSSKGKQSGLNSLLFGHDIGRPRVDLWASHNHTKLTTDALRAQTGETRVSWSSQTCKWGCLSHNSRQFWKRKWQPTAVLLPGKSHGQKNLAGYSPWGCKLVNWFLTKMQKQFSKSFQLTMLD